MDTADDGSISHAQLSWGPGGDADTLMLSSRKPDSPFDTGRTCIYLAVATRHGGRSALRPKAVAAGATVVYELVDQPYGSREFGVSDPEGNVWCVGTYRPVVSGAS